ncbi:ATP-binding protein [Marinilactibacillus kalidii]|uniref:ATP-binding protein n=1 Tax=Marinilactibacillus kalidii TaxID=2820274 RepID=UPI001ABE22B2|nr:ATP-binding protein [Marinilactibacillus kalidii]
MKTSIVVKLFLFTSLLCMTIVASIYCGQTLFFEYYYENSKIDNLSKAIDEFKQAYISLDEKNQMRDLEQQFYQENNAWIVALDEHGYIEGTTPLRMDITGISISEKAEEGYIDEQLITPIEYLLDSYDSDHLSALRNKESVFAEIHGIEKDDEFYTYAMILTEMDVDYEHEKAEAASNTVVESVNSFKNQTLLSKIAEQNDQMGLVEKVYYGEIKNLQVPNHYGLLYSSSLTSKLFFEQIKVFQARLLFDEFESDGQEASVTDFEENGIQYKMIIDQGLSKDGQVIYFFTMASLQPIDEAVGMMRQYYIYIIIGVILLILFAAFYYSKMIAKPLIRMNNSAKRIANLDFSERIDIRSKDEIGELSQNINFLSDSLHERISMLQGDIQKERQLENTRKEFIASVSHELKTPLSIMKSCISILQDEVAVEKRDHFFAEMDAEVNRMNQLIVDMLELAKFESGTYKMKKEVFALDVLVRDTCQQLFIKLEEKRLIVQMALEDAEIIGNEHWIKQVVMNSVINAITHTPEGKHIRIAITKESERIRLSIENEGNPIEETQLNHIWDRFYQIEKSQRTKEGTGLGLAISKNIMLLHDGEYGVRNTEHGVEFYFYFELAKPDQ